MILSSTFRSKIKKKKAILASIIVFLALAVYLISFNQKKESEFNLTSKKNKFSLSFEIEEKNKIEAEKFLEKLGISQSIFQGTQFELDSTSSAKLAFLTPVEGTLNFEGNRLEFFGKTDFPPNIKSNIPSQSVKIPKSTNIAIFSEGLINLIERNYKLSEEFKLWLSQNIKSENGEHLLIFGENNDFALVFTPKSDINFSTLKDIKPQDTQESLYKQETEETINYHLFKNQEDESTFTFFEIGKLTFMTSSKDSASQLAKIHKQDGQSLDFLNSQAEPVAFAILVRNTGGKESLDSLDFFTSSDQKLKPIVRKVKEILFIFDGEEFSGYVDVSP